MCDETPSAIECGSCVQAPLLKADLYRQEMLILDGEVTEPVAGLLAKLRGRGLLLLLALPQNPVAKRLFLLYSQVFD